MGTVVYTGKAQDIIQHANELLATGGYNGFSFADIATRVGVRKASIHHHFPTKAALVQATVALHRQAVQQGLQALDASIADPHQRLLGYCSYWAECIRRSSPPICICALLAAELPSVPEEVAVEVSTHFHDLHAWISATLAQGAASGALALRDTPAAEASLFMAAIHGAMLAARAAGQPALFKDIAAVASDRLKP